MTYKQINITNLGEIAVYINGYAFKPSDWSEKGVPIIRIQDLTGNSYRTNRYNGVYDKKYEVLNGDILISWSASLVVYVWSGEKAVLNQHIFKVILDEKKVDRNFYIYQVENILYNAANQAHGATMKHLTKPIFNKLPFYLPTLEEQRKISSVLDKVDALINWHKLMIDNLEQLVKSRFVEMFGDPVSNPKYLKTSNMTLICEIIDGDRGVNYPKQDEFSKKGYCLFLNAKNVTKNGFCFNDCMFISEKKDKLLRKGKLCRGDVILTTRGTIGNLAYYGLDVPFENIRINSGMVILRMDKSKILETFFIEQFKIQLQIIKDKIASGSAQPQLPISTMNKINMILPDIKLQQKYTDFVKAVDKLKSVIQQSLEELETLKKSLMQKYFNGVEANEEK